MSPYDAVKESEYMKRSGEWNRRKQADEEDQRAADRRQKEVIGEDHPSPYRSY